MKIFPVISVASVDATPEQRAAANYLCNGVADDVDINAALTLADTRGGATVQLTTGGFNITDTLKIGDNTVLRGLGPNSQINVPNAFNKIVITNKADYTPGTRHGTGNEQITLRDLRVEGNKYNQGAGSDDIWCVGFNTVEDLDIKDLVINEGWPTGIRTEFCTNVKILTNRVHDSGDDCIAINEETFRCLCKSNVCTNAGQGGKTYGGPNGIEVQDGSRDIIITNNIAENCTSRGLYLGAHSGKLPPHAVTFSNNNVVNCVINGIFIAGIGTDYARNIAVTGNTFRQTIAPSHTVFDFGLCDGITITGNTLITNDYGVSAGSNKHLVFADNILICSEAPNNNKRGMRLYGTYEDMRIDGNMITNFGYRGILIAGDPTNIHIVNNHIVEASRGDGCCIYWEAGITSSRCHLNANHLQGAHWSYDAQVAAWNVLAANWTEDWNDKDIP